MDSLFFLTLISIIILIGLFCTVIAQRLNVPRHFILIIIGLLAGSISYEDKSILQMPQTALIMLAVVALIFIIFENGTKLRLKHFDESAFAGIKLSLSFFIITASLLSFILYTVLKNAPLIFIIVFSAALTGTSFFMLPIKTKISHILEIESITNTILATTIPFLILTFSSLFPKNMIFTVASIKPVVLGIILGLGVGIFISLLLFKFVKNHYIPFFSPFILIISIILSYTISELIGGNGILSVAVFGIFFGNTYLHHKLRVNKPLEIVLLTVEIIIVILAFSEINIPIDIYFFRNSLILFFIYLLARYFSADIVLPKLDFKEKLYITLNAPKGFATIAVAFALFVFYKSMLFFLPYILSFVIYSTIISIFVNKLNILGK